MSTQNVNVTIGGPSKSLDYTYKTVVLKSNLGFAEQIGEDNVKYVVKWNFDLGGQTVEFPAGCILYFDGGKITNGTLVGNDTYIGGDKSTADNITSSVTLEGTWKHNAVVGVDGSLSDSSTNPVENKVVKQALDGKVDKVEGKGLSSNDYTDGEKAKLGNYPVYSQIADELDGKVDKVVGKGLSDNNFTNDEKAKLGNYPEYSSVSDAINGKVDKAEGKGLSSNDYTNEDKAKLGEYPSYSDLSGNIDDKAGKDTATASANGLMSAGDKAKLNSIQPNAEPNVIEHILVNGEEVSVNSKTASIECVTLDKTTNLLDPAIVPPLNQYKNVIEYPATNNFPKPGETNKIYISRETNSIYCWRFNQGGVEGAYYMLGGSGSGSGLDPELLDKLIEMINIIWPDYLPAGYSNVIDWILARLEALENPGPKKKYPTIDYSGKFDSLITAFNNTVPINNAISAFGPTWVYLKAFYDEAETQFKNDNSPFFDRSNFAEIEGYEDIPGLGDTNVSTYELAFDAMTAWLMAMCLSELNPTIETRAGTSYYNNQTVFFKTAYDYGRNGRSVALYDNYDLHCDPMHARFIAGAIYSKIRGTMSSSTLTDVRTELHSRNSNLGNIISTSGWTTDEIYKLKCTKTNGSDIVTLGYMVNSRLIIPDAPGPYIPGTENRHDKPYEEGQSASLFYTTDQEDNWAKFNYIVDYLVDKKVCENYLMGVKQNDISNSLAQMKTLWGLTSITEESYSHEKKTTILNAATAPFAFTRFFFGSRKAHLDNITPGTPGGTYMSEYTFKFSENVYNDGKDYVIGGPFADIEDKVYSSRAADATISTTYPFLKRALEIGDNSRYPTYGPEHGRRRRPLGGLVSGGSSTDAVRSPIYGDPLNGIVNCCIASFFADTAEEKNTLLAGEDWPHDPAASYPSGHTSQTMTVAFILGQLYANNDTSKLLKYMKAAYAVGVGRSIARYHWYSDIIYGRLFATMVVPLINALDITIANYEAVKSALISSIPPQGGSASVIYNSGGTGSGTINVSVQNNTLSSIKVSRIQFAVVGKNPNVENGVGYIRYGFSAITIPAGETVPIVIDATIASATQYYNCDPAPNTLSAGYSGTGNNIGLSDERGVSMANVVGLPVGTDVKDGMTYVIAYGSGTSTATDNSGSSSEAGITVNITNNTGIEKTFENKLRFVLEGPVRTNAITLGSTDIVIPNGETASFTNITLDSTNLGLTGTHFGSNLIVDDRNYESNIVLYDTEDNAVSAPMMPTTYTFEDNATYNIVLGNSGSTDNSRKFNLTINNPLNKVVKINGEVKFFLNNSDDSDYYDTGIIHLPGFVAVNNNAITIPAGGSLTFNDIVIPAEIIELRSDRFSSLNLIHAIDGNDRHGGMIIYDYDGSSHNSSDVKVGPIYLSAPDPSATINIVNGATYKVDIQSSVY